MNKLRKIGSKVFLAHIDREVSCNDISTLARI